MKVRVSGIAKTIGIAVVCAFAAGAALAQSDYVAPGSDLDVPLDQYLKDAGPDARLIKPGKLSIDRHRMLCGRRPTVMDPKFDSWGGAYPGYVILNPDRLKELPTPVKLFIYAHECGHQFVGRNETAADCFGVKRGRRYGWLDEKGLDQVCEFISKLKASAQHEAGPERCKKIRICYKEAAPRATRSGSNTQ